MFTFVDTPVKFIGLLVLFAWCTVWCGYELTRPQSGRQRISNVLHLLMAVVMLLMVAGPTWTALTTVLPDVWLAVGVGLATGWFVYLGVASFRAGDRSGGRHGLGHAAMFGAMTWHLAVMAAMSAAMSGTDHMGGHADMAATLRPFALVGLPFMAYLLVAAVRSAWLAVAVSADSRQPVAPDGRPMAAAATREHGCHEVRPVGSAKYRLAQLADLAMNGGMFWMSTGLLVPILPFFAALSF